MDILQPVNSVMGVNLGCRQTGMPQQLFYRIDVSPVIQHMSCEGMTQNVRTFFVERGYYTKIFIYHPISKFMVYFFSRIG